MFFFFNFGDNKIDIWLLFAKTYSYTYTKDRLIKKV